MRKSSLIKEVATIKYPKDKQIDPKQLISDLNEVLSNNDIHGWQYRISYNVGKRNIIIRIGKIEMGEVLARVTENGKIIEPLGYLVKQVREPMFPENKKG